MRCVTAAEDQANDLKSKLRSWVQIPPGSIFINLDIYGIKSGSFLTIVGQNSQH
jgi:hypothetical protein